MNYRIHHMGDYRKRRAHFEAVHDGYEQRLRDIMADREDGIPEDQVFGLVSAKTKAQRAAVQFVLGATWYLQDGKWRTPELDDELSAYLAKQEKARRSANARWSAMQSQSDRNANASADAMRSHCEGNAPNPNPNTSDADASGAAAPPDRPPTIWDVGEKLLGSRSYIGKLITDYGEANVTAAIARLSTLNVNEPRAWIKGVLDAEKRNGSAGRSTRSERYAETIAGLTGGRSNEPIDGTADRVD